MVKGIGGSRWDTCGQPVSRTSSVRTLEVPIAQVVGSGMSREAARTRVQRLYCGADPQASLLMGIPFAEPITSDSETPSPSSWSTMKKVAVAMIVAGVAIALLCAIGAGEINTSHSLGNINPSVNGLYVGIGVGLCSAVVGGAMLYRMREKQETSDGYISQF